MLILRTPTVYPPQGDTWLLAEALAQEDFGPETRLLDLCAGTGAVAVTGARYGIRDITAVDISRRAVVAAWLNTRLRGLGVRVHRGDLFSPVSDRQFDIIVSNPPYVPAADDRLPERGPALSWDAGRNGRAVLDRICDEAGALLAPGGTLLVVFSSLCGEAETLRRLAAAGLFAEVTARSLQPFGPVLAARAGMLEARGLIAPGQRYEELVVVRGRAPD